MSNILTPGAVNLECQVLEAPNAQPASVVLQSPGKVSVAIVGGLTKLQEGALQIAAGLAAHGYYETKDCAARAVEIAAAVLVAARIKEQEIAAKVG